MVRILSFFALSLFCFISSSLHAVDVTFSVNMQNQVVSSDGVHIEGNFQDPDGDGIADNPQLYDWDAGAISMFDLDGDGIYSISLELVPAVYYFKFVNGNNVVGQETVPATCAVSSMRNYRAFIISEDIQLPSYCFGECANCGEHAARIVVDASATAAQGNDGVSVVGNFQGGDNNGIAMLASDFGHLWTVIPVSSADVNYSFVDGTAGGGIETATNECMNAGVRTLSALSQDTILSPMCFNSCTTCFEQSEVHFRVDMSNYDVAYEGVFLVGSMSEWRDGNPDFRLTDDDGDMVFELTTMLYHWTYEYYITNGFYDIMNPFMREYLPPSCGVNGRRTYETTSLTDTVEFCFNQCIGVCEDWPQPAPITFKVDFPDQNYSWATLHIDGYPGAAIDMDWIGIGDAFETTIVIPGPAEVHYYFSSDGYTNEFDGNSDCIVFDSFLGRVIDRTQLNSNVLSHCFATCENECPLTYGCADETACNFDPSADLDDGSCIPASECTGCMNWSANNYNSNNIYPDESCLFDYHVIIFEDLNSNGIMDETELPVPGLAVECQGQVLISDASGQLTFADMTFGDFVLSLQLQAPWINCTTPMTLSTGEFGGGSMFYFGINQEEPMVDVSVSVMVEGENICDMETTFYLHIQNIGNAAITADVNAIFDSIYTFEYAPLFSGAAGDTISIQNLGASAGSGISTYMMTIAPSFLFMGDTAHHSFEFFIYLNGLPHDTIEVDYENEILCAYDPNDKTVFPAGYRDEHFILADQDMRYRVRFQNTGNAPASRVVVRDVIDEDLDLSTFHLLHATHDYEVEIDPLTREVSVIFDDINLPASIEDEPGSHGQFEYTIHTSSEVEAMHVIENTAYIYFDQNPAIITNTTWNTIFDCAMMPGLESDTLHICLSQEAEIAVDSTYVEDYTWWVNGELSTAVDTLVFEVTSPLSSEIALEVSNPLCTSMSAATAVVHEQPEAAFIFLTDHLQAIEPGVLFTWTLDGEVLQSSSSPTLYITESGDYSLEIESEYGCTNKFSNYVILGVNELGAHSILAYPNPADQITQIKATGMGYSSCDVFDVFGKRIRSSKVMSELFEIETSVWPSGVYVISLKNDTTHVQYKLVVQH